MKKKLFLMLAATALLILTGASCSSKSNKNANDGGIYKSLDKGETWAQKIILPTAQGVANIGQANIKKIIFDPQDNQALYLIIEQGGLIYSYNGGEWWQQANKIQGSINDLAISPTQKCVIYVAQNNKILKSDDCVRSFAVMYFDSRLKDSVTAVAVDQGNANIVYAAMSNGDLLKSLDAGLSWTKIYNFGSSVKSILMDPKNVLSFYAATAKGAFKTADGGASWQNMSDLTQQFKNSREIYSLFLNPAENNSLFSLSAFGLLKSIDGGQSWNKVELLTPPGGVKILAAAVSPINSQEIYYVTASTFYKTIDGGNNWITKKLVTSRAGNFLLIDPADGKTIYLGTALLSNKK